MKRIFSIVFALVLAVSLMLVPAASVGASPGPGLVGLWHFDEGTGPTAYDSSGNANNGTITGAIWEIPGKFGNALSFDGTDDYVQVPSSLSLAPTSALTIEAWVYMVSAPSNMRIVCKPYSTAAWTDPYADYELVVLEETGWAGYPGRAVYFGLTLGGSWTYLATTGTNMVPLNTWTHLAATYNGSTMAIYINGQQKVSKPASGAIASSGQPLFIGSRTPVPNEVFSGKIDEVRIWDQALGDNAIEQSHELGGPQSETDVVVQLKHKVLISGEVVCFTSAFYLDRQEPGTDKTVDIYIMSSSGDREIEDVGLRRVTPGNTDGDLDDADEDTVTHWTADVTNGTATAKGKTSTSIHLYAELDTLERLGVNAQYLPWD